MAPNIHQPQEILLEKDVLDFEMYMLSKSITNVMQSNVKPYYAQVSS